MKASSYLPLAILAFAPLARADVDARQAITPLRSAIKLAITRVDVETKNLNGHAMIHVMATATFLNRCYVPSGRQLIKVVNYADDRTSLDLLVLDDAKRLCPDIHAPVTATIDMGSYQRPRVTFFQQVMVNGVMARAHNP